MIKSYTEVSLMACLAFSLMSGCKEEKDQNTLSAHAGCVQQKSANGLSQEGARSLCSTLHQESITIATSEMTGRVSRNEYSDERFNFSTTLKNEPTQTSLEEQLGLLGEFYIITAARIQLTVGQKSDVQKLDDLWIEPAQAESLRLSFYAEELGLAAGQLPQKGEWNWSITVLGIRID